MRSKYGSRYTECKSGHRHDSKREAVRCNELRLLEATKAIKNLKFQPVFPLQPEFEFAGKKYRAIKYFADFSYYDNEREKFVVEDTKGKRTYAYTIKMKMLLYIMRDRDDFEFMET
jgi:hypothetical protein